MDNNINKAAAEVESSAVATASVPQNTPASPVQAPYYPYSSAIKKRKKEVSFEKKDKIFMLLFVLASALIAFVGVHSYAVGLTVSIWALTGITAFYLFDNGDFTLVSACSLAGTLISSLSFTLYGPNGNNEFLAVILTVICYAVFSVSLCDWEVFDSIKGFNKLLKLTLFMPCANIAVPVKAFVGQEKEKRKSAVQIFAALLVSIPLLCVIIPLLINSDAAFEGLINYAVEKIGIIILNLFMTLLIAFPVMSFAVTNRHDAYTNGNPTASKPKRPLKNSFTVTLLIAISLVYLSYIFSQLAYFVNSFKGILPAGFTFSDYARRGFFESETVAFINLTVTVLLMYFTVRNEEEKLSLPVKIFMCFVSLFSVFLISTAIAKMLMYIQTYGLTCLRLFTSVFMLSTCAFILAVSVKIFNPNLKTVKYAVSFTLVAFSLLSLAGMERTVAQYNVNAYLTGKHESIDIEYLYELGDTAVPYIAKLRESEDENTAKEADEALRYIVYISPLYFNTNKDIIIAEYDKDYHFNLTAYKFSEVISKAEFKKSELSGKCPFYGSGEDDECYDADYEWYEDASQSGEWEDI